MRSYFIIVALVFLLLAGCTMGKKNWPEAVTSEDSFALEIMSAERKDNCLLLQVNVTGAVDRLYRATIQYEQVGGEDGGCIDCPFVPRNALHITRNQNNFVLNGNSLSMSICALEPGVEYRFRVAGKSELPATPLVFTNVFVTGP